MESNRNKQTAPEAAAALPDDALGEVTGGSEDGYQPAEQDMYAKALAKLEEMDDEGKFVATYGKRAYQK